MEGVPNPLTQPGISVAVEYGIYLPFLPTHPPSDLAPVQPRPLG